jgi:hypothetical protein
VTPLRSIAQDDVVRLVQAHQREVWRYLRFLGASTELADDLTQNANEFGKNLIRQAIGLCRDG